MLATQITDIVVHTSAGFGNLKSMQDFWKNTLGWKTPGYHVFIETDGTKHYLLPFNTPSNGVAGYNSHIINICYQGGVEKAGIDKRGQVIWKGKDTRTTEQKIAILEVIQEIRHYLATNGKVISKGLGIVGHRDFSPDKDGNGVVAPWERIKECPCFEAMTEYRQYTSPDRRDILPTIKTPSPAIVAPAFTHIHVVVKGDTLSKIANSYKVSLVDIYSKNNLTSTVIKIGQKLKI